MCVAAAALAVFAPVIAYFGAQAYLRYEFRGQLKVVAQAALERIEGSVERALPTLREAASRRVAGCSLDDRGALSTMVFESPVLKEVAVLTGEGWIVCNNIGELARVLPASALFPTGIDKVSLAVVTAPQTHGKALRVIWHENNELAFGGLIPVALFVPAQAVRPEGAMSIDIELAGDVKLASIRGGEEVRADSRAVAQSTRLPVRVGVAGSSESWVFAHQWIIHACMMIAGAFGVVLAAYLISADRRRPSDPMSDMEEALERGEFIPHYQPILDIDTGRVVGCEVLVRWRKADGTIIPPGAFIGAAERSGFIFPLTLALMRQAAAEIGPAYALRPNLKCGFNLCAAHFKDEGIVADVVNIFGHSEMKLSQVLLEVTERDPLPDLTVARGIIARLQDLGVRVALDDVGTGHGGMSYLLKLGVDVMKIDKLFIDALGAERQSTAIVDSLIDLAAHLNMDVVAEGVETFAQVEALRRRGVRSAQGYVFAPPLPASSYIQLIEATEPVESKERPPVRAAIRG